MRQKITEFKLKGMRIVMLFLILLPLTIFAGKKNDFSALKYDSVVIYDYTVIRGKEEFIVNNGKLSSAIKRKATLSKSETSALSKKMQQADSYGGEVAACFDPHLGIVFYCNGQIAGHMSVCFYCNLFYSSFDIKAKGEPGMSAKLRFFLNDLLKKYQFSHQMKQGIVN